MEPVPMELTDKTSPDGNDQWNWPMEPVPMELADKISSDGIDRWNWRMKINVGR